MVSIQSSKKTFGFIFNKWMQSSYLGGRRDSLNQRRQESNVGSLKTLATSMRKRAKRLPTLASDVAEAGSRAVLKEWLEVMPVDTSEAISNTRIGIGQRPQGTLPPFFLGRKGSTRSASASKALEEGIAALQSKQPGQPIYISNTARHIGDLDRGTSAQFAGGFIPRALIVFRLAAQEAAKRLLR